MIEVEITYGYIMFLLKLNEYVIVTITINEDEGTIFF